MAKRGRKKITKARIVSDPIAIWDGGFRAGAEFTTTEVDYMLNSEALAPGTIVEYDGQLKQVNLHEETIFKKYVNGVTHRVDIREFLLVDISGASNG